MAWQRGRPARRRATAARNLVVVIALAVTTGCATGPDGPVLPQAAPLPDPASSSLLPESGSSSPDPPPSNLPQPSDLPPSPSASPVQLPDGPLAPLLASLPVQQPVVFLGIDDGYTRSPWLLDLEQRRHLPFSMFLEGQAWSQDVAYWSAMQRAGATVEDHTLTHPVLTKLSDERLRHEICAAADAQATAFGTRPRLFRPPYGISDRRVQRAAADCGMQAVIVWDAAVNDGHVQYGTSRRHLQAGDIVLMHFRPTMQEDMTAFLDEAAADHLALGRLEDYLVGGPVAAPGSPSPDPGSSAPPTATTRSASPGGSSSPRR